MRADAIPGRLPGFEGEVKRMPDTLSNDCSVNRETSNYYATRLNANGLAQVYDTAIPRVAQYLAEEIAFVRGALRGDEAILEVGAGYGRIMKALAARARLIRGIDISSDNVALAEEYLKDCGNCSLTLMDVHRMTLAPSFDVALCLQNALSAVKGDAQETVGKVLSVLRDGGCAYFSTYCAAFWEHRLQWFIEQAEKGLVGEVDLERTGGGRIVCRDGFTATTFTEADFERLGAATGFPYRIVRVDDSSLFLIVEKPSG